MKMVSIISAILFTIALAFQPALAQKGHSKGKGNGHGNSHGNKGKHSPAPAKKSAVYHSSPGKHYSGGSHHKHAGGYHHKRVKIYHPVWSSSRVYAVRWVYCPRYNFYWDSYNNMYLYISNGHWVRTYTPPGYYNLPAQHYHEIWGYDDMDYIYHRNSIHINLYLK